MCDVCGYSVYSLSLKYMVIFYNFGMEKNRHIQTNQNSQSARFTKERFLLYTSEKVLMLLLIAI